MISTNELGRLRSKCLVSQWSSLWISYTSNWLWIYSIIYSIFMPECIQVFLWKWQKHFSLSLFIFLWIKLYRNCIVWKIVTKKSDKWWDLPNDIAFKESSTVILNLIFPYISLWTHAHVRIWSLGVRLTISTKLTCFRIVGITCFQWKNFRAK